MIQGTSTERQKTDQKGLILRLSEVAKIMETRAATTRRAVAEALSEDDVRQILGRLEPLPTDAEEVQEFAFPPRSLPPPQTGQRVEMDLGEDGGAEAPAPVAEPGLLEVLSYAPSGEVELAAQLTIVFSRPMVDLSSRTVQDLQSVPARLAPQPAGRWRWLDTRTLTFEPPERFPMATEYAVEIPAGTRALDGSELSAAVAWTFSTPPPLLVRCYPTGKSNPSEPLLFLGFNQGIMPARILPHISTTGEKSQRKGSLQLATDEEVQADKAIAKLIDEAKPGSWLVVRPCEPLPIGARSGLL